MSFNNLLLENIENIQYNNDKTKKLLATPTTELSDFPDVTSLFTQTQKYGFEGNINIMPSPEIELESNLSSPSFTNNDDELDLVSFPLYVQEQDNYPCVSLPNEVSNTNLSQMIYNSQMIDLLTNSVAMDNINYDSLIGMNNDASLLTNYQMYMSSFKNSQNMLNNQLVDLNGSNSLNYNAFDQFINTTSNMEIPPLIPSTIETNLPTNNLMETLLMNNNIYAPVNEIMESNTNENVQQIYENSINKNNASNTYEQQQSPLSQMKTPPPSPLYLNKEELDGKTYSNDEMKEMFNNKSYNQTNNKFINSSIDINEMNKNIMAYKYNGINGNCISNVSKIIPMNGINITEISNVPNTSIPSNSCIISSEYNYKNKNISIPFVKREFEQQNDFMKPKSIKMNKTNIKDDKKIKSSLKARNVNKIQKVQQPTQIKHTFVIETPGENYGKKTSGRRRRNKKGENEKEVEENNVQHFPQVPSRPIILSLPPQKLSKIRARTSEDLDSRPFQCEFCPSAFSRKHDLKRHIRIHLGIKPYKCENCGKCFARLDALNRHNAIKGCKAQLEANKAKQINQLQ